MDVSVRRSDEAIRQFRTLPPEPKRRVKEALRELASDPYGPLTKEMEAQEPTFRVRVDNYRVLFNPGPGIDEITVFRIALREVAYEGFEHPDSRD